MRTLVRSGLIGETHDLLHKFGNSGEKLECIVISFLRKYKKLALWLLTRINDSFMVIFNYLN